MKSSRFFAVLFTVLTVLSLLAPASAEDWSDAFFAENQYEPTEYLDSLTAGEPTLPDLTADTIDPFTAEWYGLNRVTKRVNVASLPTYFEWDPEEVKLIQTALNDWFVAKGYGYSIEVDGIRGPTTSKAIKYFQYKSGLEMDGVLGPKSLKKLGLSGLSEQYYFYNVNLATVAPYDKSDYMIEVSLPDHKVRLYQWNSLTWEKVGEISCTIGKDSTPTPSGKFSVCGRKKNLTTDSRARYCTNFCNGYYFHTTLQKHEKTGRSKSHGCIRLQEKYAIWIYQNVKNGTPVIVHDRPSYAD